MTTEGFLILLEFFIGLILLFGIGYFIGHLLNLDNHKNNNK